jgi:hypothetical protein
MWHLYIFSFLAGMVGTNGVPHFVKGIIGEKHQTPFGPSSPAVTNFIWGWLNFLVAALLIHLAHPHLHELRSLACVSLGSLLIGLVLSVTWSNRPQVKRAHQ